MAQRLIEVLGEAHCLKPPTLARHHSNHWMSCFMTGGPGKEHETNKPPPTRRVQERSKGDSTCPTTSQNPSLWHSSWLNKACTTRKKCESEWLANDNPETNPTIIKPKTVSHVAELFSWVPLPYCSPPECPFPKKSLALSAHVSPRTIDFQELDKSPGSGPGRGPSSHNRSKKSAEEVARRTRTLHWFVMLVFHWEWEDARIWAHKIFISKHLTISKPVLPGFSPEDRVPYFWSLTWTPYKGCCK